ncbi:hypothetical protein PITC_054090 [Penicillium italicum]|uniref:Uncharacterized protein n=1 Tax=Penicillium italicum TaxID=40296 RepID=A0A0A2KPI7_PENIT|nr:hypothetical protein PITC_054090 [Penicillium italicum]
MTPRTILREYRRSSNILSVIAHTGYPAYSTVACLDGTCIVDSRKIVDFIERQVPLPSPH